MKRAMSLGGEHGNDVQSASLLMHAIAIMRDVAHMAMKAVPTGDGIGPWIKDTGNMLVGAWEHVNLRVFNGMIIDLDPTTHQRLIQSIYAEMCVTNEHMHYIYTLYDIASDTVSAQTTKTVASAQRSWDLVRAAVNLFTDVIQTGSNKRYSVFLDGVLWHYAPPRRAKNPLRVMYSAMWQPGAEWPNLLVEDGVCHQLQLAHAILSVPTEPCEEQSEAHRAIADRSRKRPIAPVEIPWLRAFLQMTIDCAHEKWNTATQVSLLGHRLKTYSQVLRYVSGMPTVAAIKRRIAGSR